MAQVLYLHLGDETQTSIFDDLYQSLCAEINKKYKTIQARSTADATPLLSSPSLKAILIVDAGLTTGKHHIALQKQLSAYAKAGGTIIFCCLFSSFVTPPDLNRMYRSFGLSWEFGNYHRTTFYLSQKIKSVLGHQRAIELEREYSMKAVHLKNTPVDSRVYVPLEQSRTQSMVFAPSAVDQGEAPAVFSKHGSGWIGYVGDVNNEEGSQALIMALLDLALSTTTNVTGTGNAPKSTSSMAGGDTSTTATGCSVLYLRLADELIADILGKLYQHALSHISLKYQTAVVKTVQAAKPMLVPLLKAVLVIDGAVTESDYHAFQKELAD
ncbi:MAG: hypothetical protein Q9209_001318 [Squamulea sp. 1 TL-2023]